MGEHDGAGEHLAEAPAGDAAGDEVERQDGGHLALAEAAAAEQRVEKQHEEDHAAVGDGGQQVGDGHAAGPDDGVVEVAEGAGEDGGQQAEDNASDVQGVAPSWAGGTCAGTA